MLIEKLSPDVRAQRVCPVIRDPQTGRPTLNARGRGPIPRGLPLHAHFFTLCDVAEPPREQARACAFDFRG